MPNRLSHPERPNTKCILATLFLANYLPFTQSAYWINAGTFLDQSSTYQIGQTNSPDNSPACRQVDNGWQIGHHLLCATSDYNGTQGSAYDVIYDSNRCGMNGLPRLYVYKVQSGSSALLLNVQLAGDQANQPFTTFIRNDGPTPASTSSSALPSGTSQTPALPAATPVTPSPAAPTPSASLAPTPSRPILPPTCKP